MQRGTVSVRLFCCFLLVCTLLFGTAMRINAGDAVNVILKNGSSSAIELELLDQYGGNFTVTLEGGASQNHTVKKNSEIKVKDGAARTVTADDEGKEIILAGQ